MTRKIIEVSPFWSFLSFFTLQRILLICLIFLICFELIARLAPTIIGKNVHRLFTVNQSSCLEECQAQGKKIIWKTNERGARGSLFREQDIQIAIFGSSTSINSLITQKLTWPEQIKVNVGSKIHVDNFAKDGAGNKEIESILNHLINAKYRYDAILIMDHYGHENRAADDGTAFKDWGRITSENFFLKSPELIVRYFRNIFNKEEIQKYLLNIIKNDKVISFLKTNLTISQNQPELGAFKHFPRRARSNRELRNLDEIKFIDTPEIPVTEKTRNFIYSRIDRLNKLAKQISPKVYFITQPVAYDKYELPGVSKKWFNLIPIAEDKHHYISNKSRAFDIRKKQAIVIKAAMENNADIIDLDNYLRPQLKEKDDMFFDKWHLTPQGNKITGKFIADRLISDKVFKKL